MSTTLPIPALRPPTAMLPPPPPSESNRSPSTSESSPSRKRRRDESVGSSRSNFSVSTKNQLSNLYGGLCWQCGAATAIHNCHVIAQKDRAFGLYKERGLLTFDSLANLSNGVRLCPNCHSEFDDIQCPGFIFFPSNLRFFIDYENNDYERRMAKAQMGHLVPGRTSPTSEEYLNDQTGRREGGEDAIGGLYQRYFLRDYRTEHARDQPQPTLALKPWHGSPMATIMRTFLIHGSAVTGIAVIPQEQRDYLRALQDLYLRPDPNNTMSADGNTRPDDPVQIASTRPGSYTAGGPSNPTSTGHLPTSGAREGPHLGDSGLEGRPPQDCLGHKGTPDSAVDVRTRDSCSARNITVTAGHGHLHGHGRVSGGGSAFDPPTKKRKLSNSTQQRWTWGPESSSCEKATWYPKMMQWDARRDT